MHSKKTGSHLHTGQSGEEVAASYLQQKGYVILARNWRHMHVEIDLVAQSENVLVFCEVKTRSSSFFGHPEEAVSQSKQERLQAAAEAYLEAFPHPGEIRFDVLAVLMMKNRETEITHIEDAFFPFESG